MTSNVIVTVVAGGRAEVVSIIHDDRGPVFQFKNLDHTGKTDHTFLYEGEVPEQAYERID